MANQAAQTTLTKEDMIKILSARTLITKPGKYRVRVTGVASHVHPDRGLTYIVNLNAMTAYKAGVAMELLKAGDVQGAGNTNLTSNQRPSDYLPVKGEFVNVIVDEIQRKDGQGTALVVAALTEVPVETAAKFDAASAFAAFEKSGSFESISQLQTA